MAIAHARPGQVVDVGPLGAALVDAKTVALFKSRDLELMRLVLPAGKSLREHSVTGEVVVHCIEGAMTVTAEGQKRVLRSGNLLFLSGGTPHSLTALEDALVLVTIALPR